MRLSSYLPVLAAVVLSSTTTFADDWALRRSPFDPRLVARYKRLLESRPNDGYALAKLVKLYRSHSTLKRLLSEYQRKAKMRPKSFALQVVVGHLCRRLGQPRLALEHYEAASRLRPKSPSVPAAMAKLYRKTGQNDKARQAYKRALSLARTKRQKKRHLRALAAMALADRDLEGARAYFKRLVALDPRNIFVRIELAQALARAKLQSEAIAEYRKILKRTNETATRANVLKEIGRLQQASGKSDQAIASYRKAMRLAARGHFIRRELTDRIISIYRDKERLKDLITHYEKTWKRRGHFEWAVLARLYDETGDEERAKKCYRQALTRNKRAIETRGRLIALLERSGQAKEVISQLRILARTAPGEPRYQLDLARRLHRSGKGKEALAVLRRCGQRFPRDASVHAALADLYARWGHAKLAMREARVLVRIEPRDESHIINLGEQQYLRGQKRRALETWRRLIGVIPHRHKAYARLAAVLGDHDMTDKAVTLYRKAIKLKPKSLTYVRSLALLLERKRRHKEALAAWKRTLALAQQQKALLSLREARTHAIDIMHRTYRLRPEMRLNQRRFEQKPPDLDAGFFLAEAHRKLRDFDSASRVYREILRQRPRNLEALAALEGVYRQQRKLAKAVSLLKRLAKLQPTRRKEYYQRIANLELMLYNDKEALRYAHLALGLGRQDGRSYQRLGELYEKKEDFKGALAAYRQAARISPNLHAVQFALARLLTRQGDYRKAETSYRKLIRNAPTPEIARRAYRKGVVLSSYLGMLDRLEKDLIPLAVRNTRMATTHRTILVSLYRRRVPMLIYRARQGSPDARGAARHALAKIGVRGMAPLLEQLANPSTPFSRRRQLIRMLGYLGNPNAIAPLMRIATREPVTQPLLIRPSGRRYSRSYLRRNTVDLRIEATVAVGRLADRRATQKLMQLLRSREGGLRDAAAWALSRQRSRPARRALFAALADNRQTVQAMACAGLGIQRDPRLRPVLEEVMLDEKRHEHVRASCAWALGVLGDQRAIESLATALRSGYGTLQRCAAWSLGALATTKAVPRLLEALWSRKPKVRQAMLWALARSVKPSTNPSIGTPDVHIKNGGIDRSLFVQRLTDSVDHLAETAVSKALSSEVAARSGAAAAVGRGVLAALMRHRDVLVKVLAELDADPSRLALGILTQGRERLSGPERVRLAKLMRELAKRIAPKIAQLLGHADPVVQRRAVSILIKLGQADLGAELMRWWQKLHWRAQVHALAVLRTLPSTRTTSALLETAAASPEWQVREAAAPLLRRLPGPQHLKILRLLLVDKNGFVRDRAARALKHAPRPGATPLLDRALTDPLAEVRYSALGAITPREVPKLAARLRKLTADTDPKVAKTAGKVLAAQR